MAGATVIVEGILMIAAIVAASIFASSFMVRFLELRDTMSSAVREYNERARTSISIVYTTYLRDCSCFVVYAMNTGRASIVIPRLTIYFGNYTKLDLYTYDINGITIGGEWTYSEVYGVVDGIWNPGETIAIYIYNATEISPPYIVKIVTPSGFEAEEVFASLP